MDSNIAELSENQPKRNWSDLPMEMKREVVKHVDFKSSLRLRQTARLERILVDSRKFKFWKVRIETNDFGTGFLEILRFNKERDSFFRFMEFQDIQNMASLVAHVLKIGNIDCLSMQSFGFFMEQFLKKVDSIRIQKLIIDDSFPVHSVALLLSKCPKILDFVYIRHLSNNDYFPLRVLGYRASDLAKISNTKFLLYHYLKTVGILDRRRFSEIVLAFATRQNTVGTTVEFNVFAGEAILNFLPIPRRIRNGTRISTSDPSIEILFEVDVDFNRMQEVKMHFVPPRPEINNSEI